MPLLVGRCPRAGAEVTVSLGEQARPGQPGIAGPVGDNGHVRRAMSHLERPDITHPRKYRPVDAKNSKQKTLTIVTQVRHSSMPRKWQWARRAVSNVPVPAPTLNATVANKIIAFDVMPFCQKYSHMD